MGVRAWFARRHRGTDDRGAVMMIVAISIGVLTIGTAFSVDLGRQMLRRRDMQAIADVVALDMARRIDGRTEAELDADPAWDDALRLSGERNHFDPDVAPHVLDAELGQVDPTTRVFTDTSPEVVPNAVKVTASSAIDYYFAPGDGGVSRSAVASAPGAACFSAGSFAANLSSANSPLLGALINDALNINIASYEGLVGANVTLLDVATELGFGTPEQLLTSNVGIREFTLAAASVLRANGDAVNATLLETIAAQLNSVTVNMGDILDTSAGGQDAGLTSSINVLDVLAAMAFVANGTNSLGIPALNVNALVVTAQGGIILTYPPGVACGTTSAHVETAQLTGPDPADPDRILSLQVSTVPILGGLANVTVDGSVNLSLASAEAILQAIRCPEEIDVEVITSLLETSIELGVTISVLGLPPLLPGITLAEVPVSVGTTRAADSQLVTLTPVGDTERVGQPSDPLGSLTVDVGQLRGVVGSLAGLLLNLLGGVDAVVDAVLTVVVNPLIAAISNQLVQPLLELLGVQYGGADVTFMSMAGCGTFGMVG